MIDELAVHAIKAASCRSLLFLLHTHHFDVPKAAALIAGTDMFSTTLK
jgi:hypothetical protein